LLQFLQPRSVVCGGLELKHGLKASVLSGTVVATCHPLPFNFNQGSDMSLQDGTEQRSEHQAAAPRRSLRGFAAMDPQRQREIASLGGRAAHQSGHAHEFTSEEARAAGRKRHARNGASSDRI
jgi:general stress protein YciG